MSAKEPQTLLRKVSVWEKGSTENPIEAGICGICSLNRNFAFDMAYDWETGKSTELISICDSCYLELATRSKALEVQKGEKQK